MTLIKSLHLMTRVFYDHIIENILVKSEDLKIVL